MTPNCNNNKLYIHSMKSETQTTWYQATRALNSHHPVLTGSVTTDVAVIGAGYTGLSTALHLAKRGYQVTVIEAQTVGAGASGLNGGQLCSGQRRDMIELEKIVSRDDALRLWSLSEEAKILVAQLIDEYSISSAIRWGIITAAWRKKHYSYLCRYSDFLKSRYSYDKISVIKPSNIKDHLATNSYHGGHIDYGAGHLHPLNYLLGLSRAATAQGVQLFEYSKAIDISAIQNSKLLISTSNGQIYAANAVIACNGYLGKLAPRLARYIMPINNYILATEPMTPGVSNELVANNVAVADTKFVVNYFRISDDNRLLFGGGETYTNRFPHDIKSFVRSHMLKVFPQMNSIGIDYAWGGKLAITMNRMPIFGRLNSNVYYALGYSGQGVAIATLAGRVLADAIAGDQEKLDVFARVPRYKFPGGTLLRWPCLALAMSYYSLRDYF